MLHFCSIVVLKGGAFLKERIKKLRKALGLTQQELADRIGISRGNIATYETREGSPGNSVISLICREFNVNETWLRTGEGEMFVKQSREDEITAAVNQLLSGESAEFKRRLIAVLAKLKDDQWVFLEDKLREILGERPAAEEEQPTAAPAPDAGIAEKVAALERQNRELMERLEIIEKEDAEREAQEKAMHRAGRSQFR